ncbi:MAG: FtsW/RodA/SpoVE family cell cycle protein, partial [Candidatus Eisenbacteria bacterium]|nr:FtsW/RodA/SpoVE family cell cycle protein [Candidatus Eisenbacteria bacterium]
MTVTRSTYEQRQQKRGASRAPSPRARMRPLELGLLGVVTLVLILGAFMTQRRSLEPYGNQTGLVHINEADSVSQWLPLFASLPTPEDRNFAARQARQHRMEHGAYENLNALGRLQVSVLEIDQNSGLAGYQNRLRVARQAKPKDANAIESLALLSASELRDVSMRGMVRSVGEFRSTFWLSFLGLVGAFLLVHLLWVVRGFEGDSWILPLLLSLCGIGFLVTTGLQDPLQDQLRLTRFAWGVMAGLGLLAVGSQFNLEMRAVRKSGGVAFAAAIGLALLLVTLGSGPGQSDAKVNLFGFQPIELIKVLATLFFAAYFADRWEFLREIREQRVSALNRFHWLSLPRLEYFLPPVLAVLVILTFFFMQRDLGPALTLSLVFFLLYGVARGRFTMLVLGLGAIVAAFGLGYALRFPATVSSRVGMWLSPWQSSSSLGDHLAKAWWSLSSGGLTGVGIGRGSPEIVPAAHTDMVLVAIGEELGWFGFLVVTLLFSALLYRLFKACRTAKGPFSFFLATGLTLLLAIQFCIIAGGVLGLMPLSGVVTPFLSYGRTSMLINLATVGLLLSVSASPGLVRSVQIFRPALNRIGAVLGIAMIVIVGRAGAIQVVQQSKYMGEPCLVEQADDVRRFTYNPRLRSLARLIP